MVINKSKKSNRNWESKWIRSTFQLDNYSFKRIFAVLQCYLFRISYKTYRILVAVKIEHFMTQLLNFPWPEFIFVTLKDLINKPVQIKILGQSLYEDGLLWYEQMVIYGNDWISKFNDFTDFTSDFDSKIMIEWARDMEDIIEETMCKFKKSLCRLKNL